MNNDDAKRIAEAVREAAAKLCEDNEDYVGEHSGPIRSLDLDAIIASVPLLTEPWCEKGDACVCGGDTPQVRRTCDYWVEGKP